MMEPVSRFKRYIAALIDNIVVYIAAFVSTFVIAIVEIYRRHGVDVDNLAEEPAFLLVSYSFALFIAMLYFAFFESSKFRATPGKMIFKMNVLTKHGKGLTFFQSCYRFCFLNIPFVIYLVSTAGYISWTTYTAVLTIVLMLTWFLPIYFTKERKCMHDILSDTKVVKVTKTNNSLSEKI